MSRCGHPAEARREVSRRAGPALRAVYLVCDRCGTWLPMGEANDTPEALVELRAASLVHEALDLDSDWNGFLSLGMTSPEGQHGPLIEADIAAGRKTQRDLDDYLAGHLAGIIATHDTHADEEPTP